MDRFVFLPTLLSTFSDGVVEYFLVERVFLGFLFALVLLLLLGLVPMASKSWTGISRSTATDDMHSDEDDDEGRAARLSVSGDNADGECIVWRGDAVALVRPSVVVLAVKDETEDMARVAVTVANARDFREGNLLKSILDFPISVLLLSILLLLLFSVILFMFSVVTFVCEYRMCVQRRCICNVNLKQYNADEA